MNLENAAFFNGHLVCIFVWCFGSGVDKGQGTFWCMWWTHTHHALNVLPVTLSQWSPHHSMWQPSLGWDLWDCHSPNIQKFHGTCAPLGAIWTAFFFHHEPSQQVGYIQPWEPVVAGKILGPNRWVVPLPALDNTLTTSPNILLAKDTCIKASLSSLDTFRAGDKNAVPIHHIIHHVGSAHCVLHDLQDLAVTVLRYSWNYRFMCKHVFFVYVCTTCKMSYWNHIKDHGTPIIEQ